MQSVLLYPRRSRFAPNLLKNNLSCILTPGPANVKQQQKYKTPLRASYNKGSGALGFGPSADYSPR